MRKSGRVPPVLMTFRWLPPQGNGQAHVGTSVAPTPGDLAPTARPLALSRGLQRPLFRPPRCSCPSGSLGQGSPSSRRCPVHRHQVSLLKGRHAVTPSRALHDDRHSYTCYPAFYRNSLPDFPKFIYAGV